MASERAAPFLPTPDEEGLAEAICDLVVDDAGDVSRVWIVSEHPALLRATSAAAERHGIHVDLFHCSYDPHTGCGSVVVERAERPVRS
jgi:hypothetical protein